MNRAFPLDGRIITGVTQRVEEDGRCVTQSNLYDRQNSLFVYGVPSIAKKPLEAGNPFYLYVHPTSGRSRLENNGRKFDSYLASFLAPSFNVRDFNSGARDVVLYSSFDLRQDSEIKDVDFKLPSKSEIRNSFNLRFPRLLSLSQTINNNFIGIDVIVPSNDNYLEAINYLSGKNVHEIVWTFFETYSSKKRPELILFSSDVDRADVIGAISSVEKTPIEIMKPCGFKSSVRDSIPFKL